MNEEREEQLDYDEDDVLFVPNVSKQELTIDVYVDREGWLSGITTMTISAPARSHAASFDDRFERVKRAGGDRGPEQDGDRFIERNKVRKVLIHCEKEFVSVRSVLIDNRRGKFSRVVDKIRERKTLDGAGNATSLIEDSMLERIKRAKETEEEAIEKSARGSVLVLELEDGDWIDFNNYDRNSSSIDDDFDYDEEMDEGENENDDGDTTNAIEKMKKKKKKEEKNKVREIDITIEFEAGNYPKNSNSNSSTAREEDKEEDNTDNRVTSSFWSSSVVGKKGGKRIKDESVACDGTFFKAPGSLEKPSAWFPCVDVHDCLSEFHFDISCAPHLVAVAPGTFEGATWEPEVSDVDGQFRRRHKFRSVLPCVARDVCVVVGPFSAHRAYRDAATETASTNDAKNPTKAQQQQLQQANETQKKNQIQSKDGITMYIPKTVFSESDDMEFLQHYERLKFLGRGVYDCMESFENYLGNAYPVEHTRLVFLPPSMAPNNTRGFSLANAMVLFSKDLFFVDPTDGPRCLDSRANLAEALANLWFGVLLLPRDVVTDSWLLEGLAGNLANSYITKCCGINETSYRRAKEAEEVAMSDDGRLLPPCCSHATRLWREGVITGGKGQRLKASEKKMHTKNNSDVGNYEKDSGEIVLNGNTVYPFPKTAEDIDALGSYSPLSLSPTVDRLIRMKSVAVIGLLERRMGREGLQKACKYFANLQQKRTKENKDSKGTKGKDGKKKQPQNSKDAEHAQMEKMAEALVSNARWISSQHFLDYCRTAVNLGKGEIASFIERWVYGCGSPTLVVGYCVRRRKNTLEFAVKVENSPATLAADEAVIRVARNHRTSVTIRLQEDSTANDHVVALTSASTANNNEHLVEVPLTARTLDRGRNKTKMFSAPAIESGTGVDINRDLLNTGDNPVSWVRVDPEREWLATIRLPIQQVGLESMQALLLDKEMDVAAQASAVQFLARRAMIGSQTACAALEKCLKSSKTVFCRVRAEAALALGRSSGVKSKFLGLSALVSYYRRTQCDQNTGFPKPNDTRDVAETIVNEAVLLALGASVDDSNIGGSATTSATAFDCLIDRLTRNDNTGNPNSDVGLIVAALEALSISMPPDAKRRDTAIAQAVRYAHRDPVFIKSDRNVVARASYRALSNLVRFSFGEENTNAEARQKVIESGLICVDDAVGISNDNARGRRDRIATLFIDALGINEDPTNLKECVSMIAKEPNAFTRVQLLWDCVDAVVTKSERNDDSQIETLAQFRERERVQFSANKETLDLLKSCAYTDGAKAKVAACKLLRTLTIKIKDSPRHEKEEDYKSDDISRAIEKASLRATQHPEPLSRQDLVKIDPAAALRLEKKERKRARKEEKRLRKLREAQELERKEREIAIAAGGDDDDIDAILRSNQDDVMDVDVNVQPSIIAEERTINAPPPTITDAPAAAAPEQTTNVEKPKMKLMFKLGPKK
jgi:hypothetical protein